jgi:PAS domain S-box-containing protein
MKRLPHSKERREYAFLNLFQEVTRWITSTLDLDQVLDRIVRKIPTVLGVDAATIRLLDSTGTQLTLLAASGLSDRYLNRGPVDTEKSVIEALEGTPVAIFDAANDPRISYSEAAKAEGVKSILVAPIPIQGKMRGVLRLLTRNHRNFKKDELEFAAALADQCGIALQNARFVDDQKRQLLFFKTLDSIGKALNSTLELDEVLDLIVSRLPEVMPLKGCTIRLLDPERAHLELMAASGLSRRYLDRGSIDDELGTYHALRGEPVMIYDAAADERIRYRQEAACEGIASILAVPIIVKDKPIGILRLLTAEPRRFSEIEVNFAVAVAEQGGIAIQNAISYQRISKLVIELAHQEDFLQSVMDSLDEDLFVLDARHRITMVNRTFLNNHRVAEADILGKPCHQVIRACAQGNCPFEPDQKLSAPNGTTRRTQVADGDKRLEIITSPVSIFDQEGRTDFIIGAIRDVTDHVRLQEEQLARERLQGVLEMAGAAAHELNSPLFAALGTAQLALAESNATDPLYGDLETVVGNLKAVRELTQKMSSITRYESKDYAGDVKIVDIRRASRPE